MNLEALAFAVDERIHVSAAERRTARLYGVRLDRDGDPAGVHLELLAGGEARKIPKTVRPPADVAAIAMSTTAWAAPMEPDGTVGVRPSQHPERRRVHVTMLVGGDEAADVSVLRYADDEPQLMRGGVGVVHERMVRCWARRRMAAPPVASA